MYSKFLQRVANANLATPEGVKLITEYYVRSGKMPDGLSSFDQISELLQHTLNRQNGKGTPGSLLKDVFGAGYKGPPIKITDGVVAIDKRKYMSADGGLPPPVYDWIESTQGKDVADKYTKAVRAEWTNMNAQTRLLENETGQPFHRGHWLANKFGGAESARAGSVEIAEHNQLHGAAFRNTAGDLPITGVVSNGWLDDFSQWQLVNDKLNVPGADLLKAADLQAISNGVPADKLIAQRAQEALSRNNKPDPDSIGFIYGSQLDRDETIAMHSRHINEVNDRAIVEQGYNPQRGGSASQKDIADAQRRLDSIKIEPAGPRGVTTTDHRAVTKLPPAATQYDSAGNIVSPRPDILAVKSADTGVIKSADPNFVTPRGTPGAYTGTVPDAPSKEVIAGVVKDYGIPPKALAVSYNAGLPGFGKQVGNLLRDNLGGSVAGLGVGLMTDPELHQAVSNKNGLKVAEYVARDTISGAVTQAAVRALPVAAGARIAAAANPVGAAVLAASAPSSTDQGKQRDRLMAHVNKLPDKKKQAAIAQIKKDDKAAAKPLIDGNALLREGINNGKWLLKRLGIKL